MSNNTQYSGTRWLSLAIVIGVAIGTALGRLLGNMRTGLMLGLVIAVAVWALLQRRGGKDGDKTETDDSAS